MGNLGLSRKGKLSDYVTMGFAALKEPRSQLRWCECGCQSGSWTGSQGSFLHSG